MRLWLESKSAVSFTAARDSSHKSIEQFSSYSSIYSSRALVAGRPRRDHGVTIRDSTAGGWLPWVRKSRAGHAHGGRGPASGLDYKPKCGWRLASPPAAGDPLRYPVFNRGVSGSLSIVHSITEHRESRSGVGVFGVPHGHQRQCHHSGSSRTRTW